MPSIRKRIGYLPSINAQEIISKIAEQEKLSQSRVVGILVEEALKARLGINPNDRSYSIRENRCINGHHIDQSSLEDNDLDELISDKGITYSNKKYKYKSDKNPIEPIEIYNKELFEQFKKFILFQKMVEENNNNYK